MSKAIGTVLRALSVIWIVFAVVRMLTGITGYTRGSDVVIGIVSLLIAIATFRFGTWLKIREKGAPVVQRVQHVKAVWWRADYGFRLSVFLGVLWAIGSYIWQDNYYLDLGLVFWPPIALLVAYFGYRKFVVGTPKLDDSSSIPTQSAGEIPGNNAQLKPEHKPPPAAVSIADLTSKDRERAMNELINKMK